MRENLRRRLAVFLTVLLLAQMVPAAFLGALADGATMIFGSLGPRALYSTVVFVNDGETIATQLVQAGSLAMCPQDPTREPKPDDGEDVGIRFKEWQSDTGIKVTDPIMGNVVFTAVYEVIEKATVTLRYVVSDENLPELSNLPPDRIYYVEKGKLADIKEKAPLILGYKVNDPRVIYENNTPWIVYNDEVNQNVTIEVNYDRQSDLRYSVAYWYEREGISGPITVPPIGEPSAQFANLYNEYFNDGVLYGTTIYPDDKPMEGFSRVDQTYYPLEEDTHFAEYYIRNEYLLTYDAGGEGATYTAPETFKYGATVVLPDKPADENNPREGEMVRAGYTFAGWESSEPSWNGPGPHTMPPRNVTVTAKWVPTHVGVTVVYWVEKPNLDHPADPNNFGDFDFYHQPVYNTQWLSGDTVVYNAPAELMFRDATVGVDVVFAELLETEKPVARGDGSTVLNVFYSRKVFTYVFSADGTEILNGYLTSIPVSGAFPDGSKTLTFDVKLGMNIQSLWPSSALAPVSDAYVFHSWEPDTLVGSLNVLYVSNRPEVTEQMIPLFTGEDTVPWVAHWLKKDTVPKREVEYYFERLPGEEPSAENPMLSYGGVDFIKDGGGLSYYSQAFYTDGTLDAKQIRGMRTDTVPKKPTLDQYGNEIPDPLGTAWNTDPGVTQHGYYRERFDLSFYSSKGSPAALAALADAEQTVMYGMPLYQAAPVGWEIDTTKYVGANHVVYSFKGWYREDTFLTPVSFGQGEMERMPDRDLKVFAKWEADPVQVTFELDDGTVYDVATAPGGTALEDSGVYPVDPSIEGKDFLGWYYRDQEGKKKAFGASTLANESMTVRAEFKIIYTSFDVRYVLIDDTDQEVQEIWATTHYPNVQVGTEILVPGDVMPLEIPGFTLVGPLTAKMKLGLEKEENTITFKYKKLVAYYYKVNYLLEGTNTVVPLPAFESSSGQTLASNAYRVLLWAKKDASGKYYPTKEFEQVTLLANDVVEINFYYNAYEFATYQEQAILVGTDRDGEFIRNETRGTRIGDTARPLFTDDTYTDPDTGIVYKYLDGAQGEVKSWLVTSGSDSFNLTRYYYQMYTITFTAGPNGHLDGDTQFTGRYRLPWSSVTVPTPVPDDGYYFVGWSPSLPSEIDGTVVYEAQFARKVTLTVQSEGTVVTTYDGTEHTVGTALSFYDNGVPTSDYTVTGIAAQGISGTNAGAYTNQLTAQPGYKVYYQGTDVTDEITLDIVPGELVIMKRQITLKPEDMSVSFSGGIVESNQIIVLAPGSNPLANGESLVQVPNCVTGGGAMPGCHTFTIIALPLVFVASRQAEMAIDVNYDVKLETGTLYIDGSGKTDLYVTAADDEQQYTGYSIQSAKGFTYSPVLASSQEGRFEVRADVVTVNAVAPGNHPIYVENIQVIWIDQKDVETDVSNQFNLIPVAGNLKITGLTDPKDKIPLTVQADSWTETFSSQPIQFVGSGTLVSGTVGDPLLVRLEMVSEGEGVIPGTYPITFTTLRVMAGTEDVTSNYIIDAREGILKILPREKGQEFAITVRADDAEPQAFTGFELTANVTTGTVTAGAGDMPAPEGGKSYKVVLDGHASGTLPDIYPVTFDPATVQILYGNDAEGWVDITENYVITAAAGNFEITPPAKKPVLRIVPGNAEATYTMFEQSVTMTHAAPNGTVVTIDGAPLPAGMVVEYSASAKGSAPQTYDILVDPASVHVYAASGAGTDIVAQFEQDHGKGAFTIKNRGAGEKLTLSITPDSTSRVFNGQEQMVSMNNQGEVLVDGSAAFPASLLITFNAGAAGFYPGHYPIEVTSFAATQDGVNVAGNFTLDGHPGDFEITNATVEEDKIPLFITPDNAQSVIFDGAMHAATVTTGAVKVGLAQTIWTPSDPYIAVTFVAKSNPYAAPGTYPVTLNASDVQVIAKDGSNTDITSNYRIIPTNSTFTINPVDPSEPKISMQISPKDAEANYTGDTISVQVTETKTPILANGAPIDAGLQVSFVAAGSGKEVAVYPINIANLADKAQFKVMAKGQYGMVDVTDQFQPNVIPGSFEIKWLEDGEKIPLYIQPNGKIVPFNGALQQFNSDNAGTILIKGAPPKAGVEVLFDARAEGIEPSIYYVNATNVRVFVGGVNMTGNYQLTSDPGKFAITPLTGDDRIPVIITPDNAPSVTFDGEWHAPTVSTGSVLINNVPQTPASPVRVTFTARTVGGVAPGLYTLAVDEPTIEVLTNDGHNTPVTDNYRFILHTGTFEIQGVPSGGKHTLTLSPDNREELFTGKTITVSVSTSRSPILMNGAALPGTLSVHFSATGTGDAVGTYHITVVDPANPAQLKVTASGPNGVSTDVTNQFALDMNEGTLTIRERQDGEKIPLFIRPNSGTAAYTGKPQTFNSDNQGLVWISGAAPVAGINVQFEARVTGFAPKTYDVEPTNVKVMVGTKDMIANYNLITDPGEFVITPLTTDADKIPLYITPDQAASVTFDGFSHSAEVTTGKVAVGLAQVPVTASNPDISVSFIARSESKTAPGTYPVRVSQSEVRVLAKDGSGDDVTSNYKLICNDSAFEIERVQPGAEVAMVISPKDASRAYTGKTITAQVTETKTPILVGGVQKDDALKVNFVATGTGVAVGSGYPIDILNPANRGQFSVMASGASGMEDVTDQFALAVNPGELTITPLFGEDKLPLYIKPLSDAVMFNGNAQTFNSDNKGRVWIEGAPPPPETPVTFKASVTATNPGTYYVNATDVHVYVDGLDMIDNYTLITEPGEFVIIGLSGNNRILVEITPNDAPSVVYDGEHHAPTVTEGTVLAGGVPVTPSSAVKVNFTARTAGGIAPDIYEMQVDPSSVSVVSNDGLNTVLTSNYRFEYGTGKFEITPVSAGNEYTMTLFPADREEFFTGDPITVTVNSSRQPGLVNGAPIPAGLTVSFVATGTGTEAGTYPITVLNASDPNQFKVTAAGASGIQRDVTSQYVLNMEPGTFTINERENCDKIPLYIRPLSGSAAYTGEPQTFDSDNQGTVWIAGAPPMAGINVQFKASVTAIAPGTYQIMPTDVKVMVGTKNMIGNYVLTVEPGKYTINPITDETKKIPLYITPDDAQSVVFDGKSHSAEVATGTVAVGLSKEPVTASHPYIGVTFLARSESKTAPGKYPVRVSASDVHVVVKDGSGKDVTSNYKLVLEDGSFRILGVQPGAEVAMEISPKDASVKYTGKTIIATVTQAKTPILVNGVPKEDGFAVSFAATGTGVAVGTGYPIDILDKTNRSQFAVMADGETGMVDVTDQFALTVIPGELTITQLTGDDRIPLYVRPNSKTVAFTGGLQTLESGNAGTIWIAGRVPPGEVQVLFDARVEATNPGTYYANPNNIRVMVGVLDMIDNYLLTTDPGILTITKATGNERVKLSITPDDAPSVVFDGYPHAATVTTGTILVDGVQLASAMGIQVSFVATTAGGTAPDVYDLDVVPSSLKVISTDGTNTDLTSNYQLEWTPGKFKILSAGNGQKPTINLFPIDAEEMYTSGSITVKVSTVKSPTLLDGNPLPNALEVTFEATGSGTAEGDYPITVLDPSDRNQFKVMAPGKGGVMADVTDQFILDVTEGTFTITPRKPCQRIPLYIHPVDETVSFTGATQYYNHDNEGIVLINGVPPLPGVNVEFMARAQGNTPGTYYAMPTDVKVMVGTKNMVGNYDLMLTPGEFIIESLPDGEKIPLYITPDNAASVSFNGAEQMAVVTEGTIEIGAGRTPWTPSNPDFDITFVARSEPMVAPGTYPVVVSVPEVKVTRKDGSGQDVTSNFEVFGTNSSFTITPVAPGAEHQMEISPKDATEKYTGGVIRVEVTETKTPIQVNGANIGAALAVSFVATGIGDAAGNAYPITILDKTDPAQFKVMAKGASGLVDVTNQFSLKVNPGTLTITALEDGEKLELYIRPNSGNVPFTGEPQPFNSDNAGTILVNGMPPPAASEVLFTARAEGFAPGTYDVIPTNVRVMVGGKDMIANYVLVTANGQFIIKRLEGDDRIPVSITPDDAQSAQFNGFPQSATVTSGTVLVNGQPLQPTGHVTVSFTAKAEGTAPATYPVEVDDASVAVIAKDGHGTDVTGNYRFTFGTSEFVITPVDDGSKVPMTLFPANVTVEFAGEEITETVSTVRAQTLVDGSPIDSALELTFVATGTGFAVGEYPITVLNKADKAQFKVMAPGPNGTGQDVTDQFDLTVDAGTLRITNIGGHKIPLYIQPLSDTRVFSGEEQTLDSDNQGIVLINGSAPLPGVNVEFKASVKGFAPGTYEYYPTDVKVMVGTQNMIANYELLTAPGALTIAPIGPGGTKIPMWIAPDNAPSVTFDGTLHVAEVTTGVVKAGAAQTVITQADANIGVSFIAKSQPWAAPGTYPVKVDTADIRVWAKVNNANLTDNYAFFCDESQFSINKVESGNKVAMLIAPQNEEREFTGSLISVQVTDTRTPITVGGAPITNALDVIFQAAGEGTIPGIGYPIDIADPADPAQFAVYANGLTGPKDVTDQFALTVDPGTLTITNKEGGYKIPLYIRPNSGTSAFSGDEQSFGSDNAGTILIDGLPVLAGTEVLFDASVSGIAPGSYAVIARNVRVIIDGNDVTSNYELTQEDGEFVITPLTGDDRIKVRITPDDAASKAFNALHQTAIVTTGEVLVDGFPLPQTSGVQVAFVANAAGGVAPGTYPVEVDPSSVAVTAKDASNTDVTSNYALSYGTSAFVITPLEAGEKLEMTISPTDATAEFTGWPQTRTVTAVKSPTLLNGAGLPNTLNVTFLATGVGTFVGTYPITIADPADRGQFKVTAAGLGGAIVDVTDQFELVVNNGTLTITGLKPGVTIGIIVSIDDPDPLTYNGQDQTVSDYTGNAVPIDPEYDGSNLTILVHHPVTGKDAKDYPIDFVPADVTIYIDGVDVTEYYDIETVPGNLKINKKFLTGTMKAARPGPSFIYGQTIPAPSPDIDWTPVSLGSEGLTYTVTVGPGTPKNVGTYVYTPALNPADNPNYDVTGITVVPSDPMVINPATLTVTPDEVWHAQGTPIQNAEFTYNIDGYQYGETQASVGPQNVQYGIQGWAGTEIIGAKFDIVALQQGTAPNYNVLYEEGAGGFQVYGQVTYNGNYPAGMGESPVVTEGKYTSPSDPVFTKTAQELGFGDGITALSFTGWTTDPEGMHPFADGTPIGQRSITLYARWAPVYKVTLSFIEMTSKKNIVQDEEYFVEAGKQFTFPAKTLAGYKLMMIQYKIGTTTYTVGAGSSFVMPAQDVAATYSFTGPIPTGD